MSSSSSIGAIVLAAGASRRMGSLKQVLPYGRTTLIAHVVDQVQQAGLVPTVVVVGAQAEVVTQALPETVEVAYNPAWSQGLGTSLACGAHRLSSLRTDLTGAMVVLADQPRVTATLLRHYIRHFQDHPCDAVALRYASGPGVPALFSVRLLGTLQKLTGEDGAKLLLRDPQYVVRILDQPNARQDIDTPAAYQQLLQSSTYAP